MFERFTDKARAALLLAQEEAMVGDRRVLGTEHLLLGLLRAGGVAGTVLEAAGFTVDEVRRRTGGPGAADAAALRAIGIDVDEVRAAVEESFGPGALDRPRKRERRKPPFEPATKKVLELGLREALALHHSYIGTEHLLLGMLREGEATGAQILADRGDLATLRAAVIDELSRLRPGA